MFLTGHLQSFIDDKAGVIFRDTCERPLKEVMESDLFREFADKIHDEIPRLTDVDIMRHLVIVYSTYIKDK